MTEAVAPLRNDNQMKLGIFCLNVSNGTVVIKDQEDAIVPTWEQNVRIAQAADAAGWEFLLPLGRWRGFKGASSHNGKQFEVFTWAAGLGAVTTQIQILATAHVPLMHPVMAAKQGATVDHITNGRFAMNVVAGWNDAEMAMFGIAQQPHDVRYEAAKEWTGLVKRLWTDEDEFDFEGDYYSVKGGYLQPKPVQTPWPVLINAGASPAGMRFGAAYCDYSFQVNTDLDLLRQMNDQVQSIAGEYGKKMGILTEGIVVCADTETEAKRLFDHYCDDLGDWEAATEMVRVLLAGDSRTNADEFRAGVMTRKLIAGWGSVPMVGTPEQIVDQFFALRKTGVDGVALSWFKYEEGLQQFNEQILPLMVDAGLRR